MEDPFYWCLNLRLIKQFAFKGKILTFDLTFKLWQSLQLPYILIHKKNNPEFWNVAYFGILQLELLWVA